MCARINVGTAVEDVPLPCEHIEALRREMDRLRVYLRINNAYESLAAPGWQCFRCGVETPVVPV
jgi:hypothetical protein